MSPRPFLGVLTALALLVVASVTGAGEAQAHGGHAHHASAAAAVSTADAHDLAILEAELSNLADEAGDAQRDADRQASNEQAPRACDGHCCGLAGPGCCSLTPPIPADATCRSPARDASTLPAHDGERDGLGPQSILRPPRIPA